MSPPAPHLISDRTSRLQTYSLQAICPENRECISRFESWKGKTLLCFGRWEAQGTCPESLETQHLLTLWCVWHPGRDGGLRGEGKGSQHNFFTFFFPVKSGLAIGIRMRSRLQDLGSMSVKGCVKPQRTVVLGLKWQKSCLQLCWPPNAPAHLCQQNLKTSFMGRKCSLPSVNA